MKVKLREALATDKNDLASVSPISGPLASSLNDEIDELARSMEERIGRLRATLKQGEAAATQQAQQAEQAIEGLKVSMTVLEGKLTEAEAAIQKRDRESEETVKALREIIQEMQSESAKKEQDLRLRDEDLNVLRASLDRQAKQLHKRQSELEKARTEAAANGKEAERLIETARARVAELESRVSANEELARQKDFKVKTLEETLAASNREFENLLTKKDALLSSREAEIADLRAQLNVLTKGIEEMSSFFKQAEALAGIKGHGSEGVASFPAETEDPGALAPPEACADRLAPDTEGQTVPVAIFHAIAEELAEITGIMKPLALLIVRDHVSALGESMENFPKSKLPEILESLAKEMSDENRRLDFRQRLNQHPQISAERLLS
ncbi:MAG TPA: hypothetical protein VNO43_16000 [Candidatus Eisenbacteria bacterium]|nr:hypothetical protein [Candidatus Eisenbacteria bacterium]